jgi:hypothetical protein
MSRKIRRIVVSLALTLTIGALAAPAVAAPYVGDEDGAQVAPAQPRSVQSQTQTKQKKQKKQRKRTRQTRRSLPCTTAGPIFARCIIN